MWGPVGSEGIWWSPLSHRSNPFSQSLFLSLSLSLWKLQKSKQTHVLFYCLCLGVLLIMPESYCFCKGPFYFFIFFNIFYFSSFFFLILILELFFLAKIYFISFNFSDSGILINQKVPKLVTHPLNFQIDVIFIFFLDVNLMSFWYLKFQNFLL